MADLESKIDQLKIELNQSARLTGINSLDTLYYSQKLDELITVYQKYLQNKHNNVPVLA